MVYLSKNVDGGCMHDSNIFHMFHVRPEAFTVLSRSLLVDLPNLLARCALAAQAPDQPIEIFGCKSGYG